MTSAIAAASTVTTTVRGWIGCRDKFASGVTHEVSEVYSVIWSLALALWMASAAIAQHYNRVDLTRDSANASSTAPNTDPHLVNAGVWRAAAPASGGFRITEPGTVAHGQSEPVSWRTGVVTMDAEGIFTARMQAIRRVNNLMIAVADYAARNVRRCKRWLMGPEHFLQHLTFRCMPVECALDLSVEDLLYGDNSPQQP